MRQGLFTRDRAFYRTFLRLCLTLMVEQAVILSAGDEIQPSELPIACRFEGESHGGDETGRVNLKLEVARFEYEYICRAYEKYGTVRAAAASLGMDSATFVRKRRKFEELLQK